VSVGVVSCRVVCCVGTSVLAVGGLTCLDEARRPAARTPDSRPATRGRPIAARRARLALRPLAPVGAERWRVPLCLPANCGIGRSRATRHACIRVCRWSRRMGGTWQALSAAGYRRPAADTCPPTGGRRASCGSTERIDARRGRWVVRALRQAAGVTDRDLSAVPRGAGTVHLCRRCGSGRARAEFSSARCDAECRQEEAPHMADVGHPGER